MSKYTVRIENNSYFTLFGYSVRTPTNVQLTQQEITLAELLGWRFTVLQEPSDPSDIMPTLISSLRRWICARESSIDLIPDLRKHDEILVLSSGVLTSFV